MRSSTATNPLSPKSSEPSDGIAVRCKRVAKRFYYYDHRSTSLRELFIRAALRRPLHVRRPVFTLQRFDLTVRRGEAVALIGPNGSGKSTALRLIAGIYSPSEGSVETHGRVAAVIELGAGFHPELTGAENAALYGAVMGLGQREIAERLPEISAFAGVEAFMDTPLKYYSSGMQARLAFAVTVCVEPDILLLDEVLAVGDQAFQRKCLSRLEAFCASGRTLVVVSHDLAVIRQLCSRAVWMERGAVRMAGPAEAVVAAYQGTEGPGR